MENTSLIIYQTNEGKIKIETRLEDETVWLTQAQMAELFSKDRTVITKHITNILERNFFRRFAVCRLCCVETVRAIPSAGPVYVPWHAPQPSLRAFVPKSGLVQSLQIDRTSSP